MHLQLFDYSLSKLCNKQQLPKSHSSCCCRYLTRVAMRKVPPPNPRLAMSVSHSSPPTVRWHRGHTNVRCWVPTSATPRWVSNQMSHRPQILLWGSPVVHQLFSRVSRLKLAATLRQVTGATWGFEPAWLSPHPILRAGYSLEPCWIHVLHIWVCLLLVFWECVINGAQWAVNIRKNVNNFGSSQMYVCSSVGHKTNIIPCIHLFLLWWKVFNYWIPLNSTDINNFVDNVLIQ